MEEYGQPTWTRLPPAMKIAITEIAQSEDKTVAAVIREAVRQFLATRAVPSTAPTQKKRTTKTNATART